MPKLPPATASSSATNRAFAILARRHFRRGGLFGIVGPPPGVNIKEQKANIKNEEAPPYGRRDPRFDYAYVIFGFGRARTGFTPLPPVAPYLRAGEGGGIQKIKEETRSLGRVVTGFTMVEVVVLLAIFVLIASVVLASFPRLSQRINLQSSNQGLALSLRKAQNMAFAVRQVSGPTGRIAPPAYGVHVELGTPTSYIIFADIANPGGVNDNRYRPGDDVLVETVALAPGVQIDGIISDIGGGNAPQQVLNVAFTVPEARMTISNAGGPVAESAEIFLRSGTLSFRKSAVVRTSGQIQLR